MNPKRIMVALRRLRKPLQEIYIATPPRLDPALMVVGATLGDAFVSGVYPNFKGNAVSQGTPSYTVDGVSQAGSYVLASGDLVAAFTLTLSATGAENVGYTSPSVPLVPHIVTGIADITNIAANGPFVIDYSANYVGSGLTVSLSQASENVTIDTGAQTITVPADAYDDTIFVEISNASGAVYDGFVVTLSITNTAPTATTPSAIPIVVPASG